ncbi:MAG: VanZ family protein [Aquificae bacterium]|nr:VanZ family protein [Aquificota bacterium]
MRNILKSLFWVYTAVILVLSFAPIGMAENQEWAVDKVIHFTEFFIFAILVKEAFNTSYWGAFFYSLFLSIFIEVVQYFLPYRSAEYGDFSADILGATSGLFMYFVIKLAYMELTERQ